MEPAPAMRSTFSCLLALLLAAGSLPVGVWSAPARLMPLHRLRAPKATAGAQLRPMPAAVFAALSFSQGGFEAVVLDGERAQRHFVPARPQAAQRQALEWLRRYAADNEVKIEAAALAGAPSAGRLATRLWLEEDIQPVPGLKDAGQAARRAAAGFHEEQGFLVPQLRLKEDGEVEVATLTGLAPYRRGVPASVYRELRREAADFRGRFVFVSSTARGGGVALMRHALIRLFRLLKVPARWHVLKPDEAVYEITKRKFHNLLQGAAPSGTELSESDRSRLAAWWLVNVPHLEKSFRWATEIVIDDYQPSGLIPFIRAINPSARIFYRSHIHIRSELIAQPGSSQRRVWDFLWGFASYATRFVSHPVKAFVPAEVPARQVAYAPATTDPLDGLNKPLSAPQQRYHLDRINDRLKSLGQTPLDLSRPYFAQVARFDPSKGIATVIESYRLLRLRLRREGVADERAPQFLLAGHGAIDDIQGEEMFRWTREEAQRRAPDFAADIKAVTLPHSDQALNAALAGSLAATQLSDAEGFEVKVTEAGLKGKAVVGTRVGGIALQIQDGKTGHLIAAGDAAAAAAHLYRLWADAGHRRRLERNVRARRSTAITVYNALRWLRLARGADPD